MLPCRLRAIMPIRLALRDATNCRSRRADPGLRPLRTFEGDAGVATLHRTKGAYPLKNLNAGPREICIKVVNKGHTPMGLARCVKVTVE